MTAYEFKQQVIIEQKHKDGRRENRLLHGKRHRRKHND